VKAREAPSEPGKVSGLDQDKGETDEYNGAPQPPRGTLLSIYVDTSVLVAYYCPELLSGKAETFITHQIRAGDQQPYRNRTLFSDFTESS